MSMVEPLSPWAENTESDAPVERRISRLFAAVPEPAPLPDRARQRVGFGLRTRGARGVRLMVVKLIAIGAVIGMAGAATAQWASTRFFAAQSSVVTSPRVSVKAPPLVPQPSLPAPPLALPEPEALPELLPPAPTAASSPAPLPFQSSRLGLEAASLEAALSELRGGGSQRGQRALAALEQHLREFAGGSLELEARVARVDALLVLGRRQDARRELSALPIENVGRKNELRLIRAELRADEDCRLALHDFQVLVDQPLPGAWAERALFGRGACLLKLGDVAGAERDFARYLERFPSGRFAEQIRAQR
jgi:hypothetical protein